jgi:RHS repeat-associated protein
VTRLAPFCPADPFASSSANNATQNQASITSGPDITGNMTHDATNGLNYTYDVENRITGAGGFTYTYDGDGNRVEKVNGSAGTLYWYASIGIIGESDLSGTMKSEYIFFDGYRVARRDLVAPTGVSYYFSDHLKTTNIVTDAQGNIKTESDFYPWGGELQFLANDSNHYKFTGKERDSESGLDYFGARYYSNGLGRFITPDWNAVPVPVPYADLGDPQSLNQYTYVRNVPTSRVDADGHKVTCAGSTESCLDFAADLSSGDRVYQIAWDSKRDDSGARSGTLYIMYKGTVIAHDLDEAAAVAGGPNYWTSCDCSLSLILGPYLTNLSSPHLQRNSPRQLTKPIPRQIPTRERSIRDGLVAREHQSRILPPGTQVIT